MTIKIAHFADTHLGYKQYGIIERELDYYETFEKIIDDIIDKNVDYVIHSGDLFEHAKPPIKALLCAQKGFLKLLENGIEVFVIAGNHDIVRKKETSIPQELYENEHFNILTIDKPYMEINEELVIAGLPFIQKSHEELVKEILYEISENVQCYKHKILMLHGGTTKHFDFNPEFELDTIPKGFDYYAMGHIHQRILEKDFNGGILSYPGSTDIKDKGEIIEYDKNGKGYNLITIEDDLQVEFVDVYLERRFLVRNIKYPELDQRLNEIESTINEILLETDKKPVVLITVREGEFDRSAVSERVYDKLEDITLTVRLNYEPTNIIEGGNPTIPETISIEELIKRELTEGFDEDIGQMGVELYVALLSKNMELAEEITNRYYSKRYNNTEGENNDN